MNTFVAAMNAVLSAMNTIAKNVGSFFKTNDECHCLFQNRFSTLK